MNKENNEKISKNEEQEKIIMIKSNNKEKKQQKNSSQSKINKKIYIDTPLRIFVLVGFVVIFAALSLIFLKEGLETKTYSGISFSERSNLGYKVYLKPNPMFTTPYLEQGKQYIASLIDYVDIDFNYNFNASDYMDFQFKYLINAEVTVHEKGDSSKVLYKKTDTLVPDKTLKYNGANVYAIRENLKVDYGKYNEFVSLFKKTYSLAVESNLKISLYVFMNGTYEEVKQPLSSSQTMSLSIPLTEQTVKISMNYKDINDVNIVEEYSNVETINIVFFVLFGVSLLITLIVTVKLVRFLNKIRVKGTEYDRILGNILKDYEGIVARVKKVPDFSGRTKIELETFDEILDISERLEKPILFIEMNKHQKSWFMVVNHNEIYKYALKLVDVDKASNEKK